MGSLIELLLKKEIAHTNHPTTLFREDSFLNNVINRILYSDFGYLHLVLRPLVVKVMTTCEKDATLLQIKGITQEKKLKENEQRIMEILDDFITAFRHSVDESPRSLLETIRAVNACVSEKFSAMETGDRPPLGIDVLFFKMFCPAMIDPVKFEMVSHKTNIPTPTFNALLTISKMLNDLALGNYDKWTPEINHFLEKRHPIVMEVMEEMLEHANGPCDHAGPHATIEIASFEEVETATSALDDLIWETEKPAEFNTLEEMRPLGPFKAREMRKRVEKLPWKIQKQKGNLTIKTHMAANEVGICASTITNIPIAYASKWAPAMHRCPELSEIILGFKYLVDEPDFFVGKILIEVGPLSPRCAQYAGWIVTDADGTIYKPTDGLPDHLRQPEPGTVALHTGVAGWMFEPVNEYQTRLTYVTCTYPKGAPTWMLHLGIRSQAKSFTHVIRLLEDSWRNPQVLDVLKNSQREARETPNVETMAFGDASAPTSPSKKKFGLFRSKSVETDHRTSSTRSLVQSPSAPTSPQAALSPSRTKSKLFGKKDKPQGKISSA